MRAGDSPERAIGRDLIFTALGAFDPRGTAVLVRTGWSRHRRTGRYGAGRPCLTANAADSLTEAGATVVGIDSCNIDGAGDGRRPVHPALLGGPGKGEGDGDVPGAGVCGRGQFGVGASVSCDNLPAVSKMVGASTWSGSESSTSFSLTMQLSPWLTGTFFPTT